jgi:hypothetical protein
LVTLPLSEAVIGSHLCSFTLDGEKHVGIAASRIIPWVNLHWRVESAIDIIKNDTIGRITADMLPDKYKGSVVSFRNDRMGARFLSLLNTIRISGDYGIPYFFTWMTHGRASEELQNPTEIFDHAYFDTHFVSHDNFQHIDAGAIDLAALSISADVTFIPAAVSDGHAFMCMGTELMVLPWETAEDVAPRYAAAISELAFSKAVQDAMKQVDAALAESGTAFHVRRGDIIYDAITSNQLWSNKYIPREFYEVLARQLTADPDHTILVFSDEPIEIARLKEISPQIMAPDEVLPAGLTLAQRDFIEIYAMSRCQQIIGPPGSGFSMAAALIGHCPIRDVTTVLDDAGQAEALDLLVTRLTERSPLFLSDGDTGQSLPFACDHLNATGRPTQALDLLQSYHKDGFKKLFFYKMLLDQLKYCGQFGDYQTVLDSFSTTKLEIALPARIEQHLSELSRVASALAANAQDIKGAQHHAAMAFWYGGGNRIAYNTFAALMARDLITPTTFPLPFDPDLKRIIPAAFGARPGSEGLQTQPDVPQLAIPPDLIVRDWQLFMGKALNRGFGTAARIKWALELLTAQFDRHVPPASIASAQGVYASIAGDHVSADKLHTKALQLDASNPLFIKRMAASMLAVDPMNPVARILLDRAANLAPDQVIYRAELANCLFTQNDKDAGLDMMQDAALTDGAVPEIAFLAARMKRQMKQTDADALALIDHALAVAPHMRRFLIMRMYIQAESGDLISAIQTSDDIIDRFGEGGDLKAWRARNIPQGA